MNAGLSAINERRKVMAERHRELDILEAETEKLNKLSALEVIRSRMKVAELCEKKGYNPLESIIDLAMRKGSSKLSPSEQLKVDFKLLDKLVGDIKSVESDGSGGDRTINITIQSFADARQKDMPKLPSRALEEYEDFEVEDIKVRSGQSDGTIQFSDESEHATGYTEEDAGEGSPTTETKGSGKVQSNPS